MTLKVAKHLPSIIPDTEKELVASLKSRDQQAFGYLYDNYAPALYGVIIKVLNDEETAKDLLQEVFVKIWRGIETYDPSRGRLYTWMLNIARNAAIDMLRSSGFNKEKQIGPISDTVYTSTGQLSTHIPTDHFGLKKIVEGLKEEYKVIIDLAYFKGYTQEEIAKTLGIPIGTVKTRARNALIQLKSLI